MWYIDDAPGGCDVVASHLLTRPWDETDNADRELMAHELVHVLRYRRLVTHPAFGCAYGIGFEESGFDYWAHPMENAARDFVTANAALI